MADQSFEEINVPNPLKNKVAFDENGIDADMLRRADDAVAALTDAYIFSAEKDVEDMKAVFVGITRKRNWRCEDMQRLYLLSHDMKGQAGTYDYHLLSKVCDKLCRFLEQGAELKSQLSDLDLQVIEVHIRAIEFILKNHLTDEYKQQGDELLKGLEEVLQKALKEKMP